MPDGDEFANLLEGSALLRFQLFKPLIIGRRFIVMKVKEINPSVNISFKCRNIGIRVS